jgi:hypothetical protein
MLFLYESVCNIFLSLIIHVEIKLTRVTVKTTKTDYMFVRRGFTATLLTLLVGVNRYVSF